MSFLLHGVFLQCSLPISNLKPSTHSFTWEAYQQNKIKGNGETFYHNEIKFISLCGWAIWEVKASLSQLMKNIYITAVFHFNIMSTEWGCLILFSAKAELSKMSTQRGELHRCMSEAGSPWGKAWLWFSLTSCPFSTTSDFNIVS